MKHSLSHTHTHTHSQTGASSRDTALFYRQEVAPDFNGLHCVLTALSWRQSGVPISAHARTCMHTHMQKYTLQYPVLRPMLDPTVGSFSLSPSQPHTHNKKPFPGINSSLLL